MINIDTSAIMELGKEFGEISSSVLEGNVQQGAYIAGAAIQSEARKLVPVDTGALRISIENSAGTSPSGGYLVTVGPTQPYGKDIELGREPGTYVSPAALTKWAKKRGLNPYAVSRAILNKGSPAQPFMFPAADAKQNSIVDILAQAVVNAFSKTLASK